MLQDILDIGLVYSTCVPRSDRKLAWSTHLTPQINPLYSTCDKPGDRRLPRAVS